MESRTFESSLVYIRKRLSQEPIEVAKALVCQMKSDLEVKGTIETKMLLEKIFKELAEAKLKVATIENRIKEALLKIEYSYSDERDVLLAQLEAIDIKIKIAQTQKEAEFLAELIDAKTKVEILEYEKISVETKVTEGYKLSCSN